MTQTHVDWHVMTLSIWHRHFTISSLWQTWWHWQVHDVTVMMTTTLDETDMTSIWWHYHDDVNSWRVHDDTVKTTPIHDDPDIDMRPLTWHWPWEVLRMDCLPAPSSDVMTPFTLDLLSFSKSGPMRRHICNRWSGAMWLFSFT